VRIGVGAHNVGKDHRISMVRLSPCDAVAPPVARHRQRIDRIHGSPRGPQAGHQKPAAGFDRRRDRFGGRVPMFGEQLQQHPQSRSVITDAPLDEQLAAIIDHRDVMVILRPIDPTKYGHIHAPFSLIRRRTVLGHAPH